MLLRNVIGAFVAGAQAGASQNTAGYNAGEITGRVIQRVAPMLGIAPDFSEILDQNLVPPELR